MSSPPKDKWDKLDIILKPVGGILTAVAVASFGYLTSDYLGKKQNSESRIQLYTQLMSQREQSDSALRKDVFTTVIQNFLSPANRSMDERVLSLELLVYNFHESLNLKPLFLHVVKQISASKDTEKPEQLKRLERVAREVSRRQLMVLEGVGQGYDRTVDLAALSKERGGLDLEPATLTVDGIQRTFKMHVLEVDTQTRELKIRMEIQTPNDPKDAKKTQVAEFWIGFFDFPMIDNTRLLHDQRVSIVLNSFDEYSADLTITCFPGSYASLKEKPYFQEVVNQLLNSELNGKQ